MVKKATKKEEVVEEAAKEEKATKKRVTLNDMLIAAISLLLIFNIVSALNVQSALSDQASEINLLSYTMESTVSEITTTSATKSSIELTGDPVQDAITIVISSGVPDFYGEELGISYNAVQPSMDILKHFDPGYGSKKIMLEGTAAQRYVRVGNMITCEYCCGAKTIVTPTGGPACGCAHSQAMRGLLAYMIEYHGDEYTDDELLRELARWKAMYFPKQQIQKFVTQQQSGQYTPDIASLLLDIDSEQLAGITGDIPLPSEITELPGMVGGC